MVWIPGGTFVMGSEKHYPEERPAHRVTVDGYDSRRRLVLEEANTIRTAWLRGGLLPDGHRQPVRDLLRHYVDVRILTPRAREDPQLVAEGLRVGAAIQSKLWQQAETGSHSACG